MYLCMYIAARDDNDLELPNDIMLVTNHKRKPSNSEMAPINLSNVLKV